MYPFKKEIEERIKKLETDKNVCERKLKEVEILIEKNNKKKRGKDFFIQEVTHKGGFGGGTEKKDVTEFAIVYLDDIDKELRYSWVFSKDDTSLEIYEHLLNQIDIF